MRSNREVSSLGIYDRLDSELKEEEEIPDDTQFSDLCN